MLVLHPYDESTKLAKAIYANMDVRVADASWYERGIGELLWQTPKEEPILMIGYGDCHGMFTHPFTEEIHINPSMLDDIDMLVRIFACIERPRYVLRKLHAYYLRKHNGNLIGIWPGAVEFARRNRLHGLFTDRFFFNCRDAEHYGKMTLDMHVDKSNYFLYTTLGKLINDHVPFYKIPVKLKEFIRKRQDILDYNFESFTCL